MTRKTNSVTKPQNDPDVDVFLAALDHPLKPAIEAVRKVIRGVSPTIAEGIKWNAPSFRTTEWFGTLNLRQGRVMLVLHLGAKATAAAKTGIAIADPTALLTWLAEDRATVTFEDLKDAKAKSTALKGVLRQWIAIVL